MAQSVGEKLDSGQPFPDLKLDLVSGGSQTLSALAAGQWAAVLFYRGDW